MFQSDEAVSTLAAKEADDDSKSAAEAALTLEAEQAAAEALEATQPAKISGERAKEHAGNLFESKVSLSALAAATIAEAATTEAEKQYELEKIETAKRLAEEDQLARGPEHESNRSIDQLIPVDDASQLRSIEAMLGKANNMNYKHIPAPISKAIIETNDKEQNEIDDPPTEEEVRKN